MKWIDIPPVWLIVALAIAWGQSRFVSLGLAFPGLFADLLGGALVGGGVLLIAFAALEFRRARTSIVPHMVPKRLITTGIFSRSRNPIYLADILILGGMILRWDAVVALPLIPALFLLIERRFVYAEEMRLRREFGAEFATYERRVRRWI